MKVSHLQPRTCERKGEHFHQRCEMTPAQSVCVCTRMRSDCRFSCTTRSSVANKGRPSIFHLVVFSPRQCCTGFSLRMMMSSGVQRWCLEIAARRARRQVRRCSKSRTYTLTPVLTRSGVIRSQHHTVDLESSSCSRQAARRCLEVLENPCSSATIWMVC